MSPIPAAEFQRDYVRKKRVVKVKGVLNALEVAYARHLDELKLAGEIKGYHYEAVTLRLADKTTYTPDFLVITNDGFAEFHEVKGFMREDANVKLKVAAEMFGGFNFFKVTRNKSGQWWIRQV